MSKINKDSFSKVLSEMQDIFSVKNKKYGNSVENSIDKYGYVSSLTRIHDKFSRFEYLVLNGEKGTDDESIYDTLIDMANYCIMTAIHLKASEKENDEKIEANKKPNCFENYYEAADRELCNFCRFERTCIMNSASKDTRDL